MALALYRKYRPATFAEVVGQDHVTEPLRAALAAGRVNHAYLFSGPRGCGKTSSARILARSLNCVQGPTPNPCGVCNSCVGLAPGGSGTVDVVELDAASHGGVDDARELRDRAFYAPAEARYRVFIIDEAHMVTTQGFNALLKIVEEPPEHLIFVFATTEPEKVLPTIRSRTHHYPFRLIPPGTLRGLLESICGDEGVKVEPAVYPLVLRAGGGSARDTLSVMDQLLAGAGEEGVTYERAISLLGVTDVALIDEMVRGLSANDGSAVYGTLDRVVEAGHDPRRFAADLLERLRDLVLLSAVPDAGQRGLINAPEDELAQMRDQVTGLGPATLTRYAEIVHAGLIEMRGATAPRLVLELLCSRMMLPAASATDAALLQRIEQLEHRPVAAAGAVAAEAQAPVANKFQRPSQRAAEPEQPAPPQATAPQPAAAPAQPPAEPQVQAPAPRQPEPQPQVQAPPPEPEPAPAPAAASDGGVDVATLRRLWSQLLAAIPSKSTQAMLMNAAVQSVDGNTVTIAHTSAPLARRLAAAQNQDAIAAAVGTVVGGAWQVKVVHGEAGGGPGAMAAPAAAPPRQRPVAPTRPSQAARPQPEVQPTPVAPRPPAPAVDDIPLPPEPDEPAEPEPAPEPESEESMMAEAARVPEPGELVDRRDPHDVLLEMLNEELGAVPIEKKAKPAGG
ncbi:DNA polymerase III subunit gamma and tau [Kutzneria sp. CA-103260]|uniref:DNA polymerase III subunit gamma and tau n=1 Tax=Kutzneria sp. CA-103260 TaxID=2802641 RepID=UPI001BA59E5A|nr:DNA polymerase III subunit gamma and tau [Kutzneria sp. CA-103260]QUQ69790.1 DNA polymerase III subunit gamma/tau [Kutzneria sp. CA-103260]